MKFFAQFIFRPVAATLITAAVVILGSIGYSLLPIATLPQVEIPVVIVSASMPGASPATMATTVATPLERTLGRISDVTDMFSSSSLGNTTVVLVFNFQRPIDSAVRDVQAAVNAAATLLPTGMPSPPYFRKIDPAAAPVMIIALTSDEHTPGQLYDLASKQFAQEIAQIKGVGDVRVSGSALPAVRVELNPNALFHAGIALDQVRQVINNANRQQPVGVVETPQQRFILHTFGKLTTAEAYRQLVVRYQNGAAIRLGDIAEVTDSVENSHTAGMANTRDAVFLTAYKTADANIIETVDAIKQRLVELKKRVPASIKLTVQDRSPTIRTSLHEAQYTLFFSVALVIVLVFLFLRSTKIVLIPTLVIPVALIGTCFIMWLCQFSLNSFSLMALTIASGFVVDDAIVMMENIVRHVEAGISPRRAALKGLREVGFTVLTITLSLMAIFLPMSLLGGMIGRFFTEFIFTLASAITLSLLITLLLTPMMSARLITPTLAGRESAHEGCLSIVLRAYLRSLQVVLKHAKKSLIPLCILPLFIIGYLVISLPKTLLPEQDTGRIAGNIVADQTISFSAMREKFTQFMRILAANNDVESVIGSTGESSVNSGRVYIVLKPTATRKLSTRAVIARLRTQLATVSGAKLFLRPVQDLPTGGRESNATYQYTLLSDNLALLREWEPKIRLALGKLPELVDVNSDQNDSAEEIKLVFDRDRMSQLGLDIRTVSSLLNNAFAQRQISTIFQSTMQYKVVMEIDPRYAQDIGALDHLFVVNKQGENIPFSAFAHWLPANAPLAVNHDGLSAATTLSFSLADNVSLSQVKGLIQRTLVTLGVPSAIHGRFYGTAETFYQSQSRQLILLLFSLFAVYILLGILYERFLYPLVILLTLPTAALGALLAAALTRTPFSLVSLIGLMLLLGLTMKSAIILLDFTLQRQHKHGLTAEDAVLQACQLRFRPILMTSLAALVSALPLVFNTGHGAEMRKPLGTTILFGLLISQLLTMYAMPVLYVLLSRIRKQGSSPNTLPK